MAKTRGDLLSTLAQKLVGKMQLYGFLTDSTGAPILINGNEQVKEVEVGANGRLKVDASIAAGEAIVGKVGIDQTAGQNVVSFGAVAQPVSITGSLANLQGIVNTVTAGTRVQLSANQACSEVTIIAKRGNIGYIYVGTVAVSSTAYGIELEAKDSITIRVANLNQIYIDSSVSGEGVSYVAV